MEIVTLDEFIADLETTFSNYAATNDIDRNSVKGWVIDCLRRFGKNICDKRETIVEIKNSRGLLPETFKSMILGLKLTSDGKIKKQSDKRLIVEKQKIENPAYWSDVTNDYFVDNCNSKITTEKIYTHYEHEDRCYDYQWLSLVPGMKSDTIATDCLNLNPVIRNTFPDQISITNRSVNTNFKIGSIYMQYNALPESDGEIAIPIISTGSIKEYVENEIRIKLAETLGINEKNSQSLNQWIPLWMQQRRLLFIEAKSEANWKGLPKGWDRNMYNKNRMNAERYTLPK
jgi:hypothetical protein